VNLGSRFLILIGALLLLGACAEANRVVETKRELQQPSGSTLYTIGWRSDLYAPQAISHASTDRDGFVRDCYERAEPGAPLPSACLTRDALFNETGAFSRNPLATVVASLLAVGGLLWFALTRIGAIRRPAVATAAPTVAPAPRGGTPGGSADPALRLMRDATLEKTAYAEEWEARQRLARPGWGRRYLGLGVLIGAAIVVAFGFLVGFVAGGELGLVTALVIYLGVAVAYVFSLTSLLAGGVHREALYQRLAFFSGVASGMLAGGLIGSLLLAPQIEWDGVRWLF
jgi:hypothetical protein